MRFGVCFRGVWFWGYKAVKDGVTVFFTMDKHGKKLSFEGTGEIIEGGGRSSQKINSFSNCGTDQLNLYSMNQNAKRRKD